MKIPKSAGQHPAKEGTELKFGGGSPENPENPNPIPENGEPLVNENSNQQDPSEYVSDPNRIPPPEKSDAVADEVVLLRSELVRLKRENTDMKAKLAEVQKQKANYSDVSRKFRIFLNLVQGFSQQGVFNQAELAKKPGSEHNIMRHIAGLAEVANKATEGRF